MSSMKQELKRVKAALPLIQRAWLYVKDHPGSTPATVAAALKDTPGSVSSVLGYAFKRRMMSRVALIGSKVKGHPFSYSVPSHLTKYELLPFPKTPDENARPRVTAIVPAVVSPVRTTEVVTLIETLTIAEARTLYAQLHKMFKA